MKYIITLAIIMILAVTIFFKALDVAVESLSLQDEKVQPVRSYGSHAGDNY